MRATFDISASTLPEATERARNEAKKFFGHDEVIVHADIAEPEIYNVAGNVMVWKVSFIAAERTPFDR